MPPAVLQTPAAAVSQRRFDLRAEMGVVDDNLSETGSGQSFKVPDNQRFAAGRQQGFGRMVGEWAHAFAAPGSENHCFHGVQG